MVKDFANPLDNVLMPTYTLRSDRSEETLELVTALFNGDRVGSDDMEPPTDPIESLVRE